MDHQLCADSNLIDFLITSTFRSDYDLFNEDRYGTLHGHADDLLAIINELREQQKVGA